MTMKIYLRSLRNSAIISTRKEENDRSNWVLLWNMDQSVLIDSANSLKLDQQSAQSPDKDLSRSNLRGSSKSALRVPEDPLRNLSRDIRQVSALTPKTSGRLPLAVQGLNANSHWWHRLLPRVPSIRQPCGTLWRANIHSPIRVITTPRINTALITLRSRPALLKLPLLPRRFVKMARSPPNKASSKTVFQD